MFEKLIEEIQAAVKPEIIVADGKTFATRPVHEIPDVNTAQPLVTRTLQSIVDYLTSDIDSHTAAMFIHVASPSSVKICGYLNDDRRREILVEAIYGTNNFTFGKYYDQETFITALQASFVDTESRREIQRICGGLVDESSVKLTDDGVSQQTAEKRGITTVERVAIKNPFALQPHRTFPEVEQPESAFVLRLHRSHDAAPTIALFEADNSEWKLTATNSIKEFLSDKVNVPVIG